MKRSRRAFLRAAALAGSLGVAGCHQGGDSTPGQSNPGGNGGTATATGTTNATATAANGTATDTASPTETSEPTPVPVGESERWTGFQNDLANTGTVPLNHRRFSDSDRNWKTEFAGARPTQPAFDERRLFVPTGHALHAIDRETNERLWTFEAPENAPATPAIGKEGFVYVVTGSGVYRLHAQDGWSAFEFNFTSQFDSIISAAAKSAPVVTGDHVIFNIVMEKSSGSPSTTSRVVALDLDGDLQWQYETSRRATTPATVFAPTPAVTKDSLYFTAGHAKQDATLYALKHGDGSERWTLDYKGKGWSSPTVKDGLVYFADRYIQMYDTDGNRVVRRTVDPPPNAYGVAAGDQYVFMSSRTYGGNKGRLFAVDERGHVEWTFEGEGNLHVPVATNDTVYVASASGSLFALSQAEGLVRWQHDFGLSGLVTASGPAVSSDTVYVSASAESDPLRLYSISPA